MARRTPPPPRPKRPLEPNPVLEGYGFTMRQITAIWAGTLIVAATVAGFGFVIAAAL